ncbi:MAG: hypothetical protein HYV35_01520 [Lentisphaerae bacterium]|nr:hypothetical protein [Lentisphaerota bacterium]
MIFVIGALFWMLALVAVGRLLALSRAKMRLSTWAWGLMVLTALVLLFRPHEDIFGGEDPGSYLNSGVTYGRQGQAFFVDPLLAQVSPETRNVFYYGHAGYGATKDACLWVVNEDAAVLGPHFQPAYPLLISVATRLGKPSWSLYVVPLFALFTAFALAALVANLLTHRLAGLIAFSLYLLNPMILWHGRCARPEIIAGFFAFAGLALLLLAWQERPWLRWPACNAMRSIAGRPDILLGALCIGSAPLFHITAWYLVIPAALAVGLVILSGRTDFLLYPLGALAMWFVFYGETRYVTDYYKVREFFEGALNYWPFWALGLAGLAAISLGVRRARQRRNALLPSPERAAAKPVAGWLATGLALVSLLFFVNVYFNRANIGSFLIIARAIPNFIFLTDWQTFANMVSRPIVLLILAGWVVWLTGQPAWRGERIALALTVLPAVVLAGTMRDFMMTRYFVLAAVPMGVLCLTALVTTRLKEWPGRPWTVWLAPGLAVVIGLVGLTNRGHLVTLVEHRGFLQFLAPFAQAIQNEQGILLGEYSRITASLEHMFGIRALGLDNERKDDYHAAERAWEAIMRGAPQQPAFFLTPFQTPRSDLFNFSLVHRDVFKDRKLQQAYNNLPTRIGEMELTLSLYRMTLKDPELPEQPATNAVALPLGNGNMGLRRAANVRLEKPELEGVALSRGEQVSLSIPAALKANLLELLFVLHCSESNVPAPIVNNMGAPRERYNFHFQSLGDQWWLYTCKPDQAAAPETVAFAANSPLFIAAAFACGNTEAIEISSGFSKARVKLSFPPLKGRWARAQASLLMPATAPGYFLMLGYVPDIQASPACPSSAREATPRQVQETNRAPFITVDNEGDWTASAKLRGGRWQWLALPLSVGINRAES